MMTKIQTILLIVLLISSVVFVVLPFIISFVRKNMRKKNQTKLGISNLLIFSGCLIVSIWCLRYAVGCFGVFTANLSTGSLTLVEEFFCSIIHALQTFSMDEEYTKYILDGKLMLRTILGEETMWQIVYGLYASILNFVAPIAGGTVLFEILANVFPQFKLAISNVEWWREKYFFSELNEASLSLAKNVYDNCGTSIKNPIFIFTDAYIDDENEKSSELLHEAKQIGAICVRNDLLHIRKCKYGKCKIFLIDENEISNLSSLSYLAQHEQKDVLKETEIYLFSQSDAYIEVKQKVRKLLMNRTLKKEKFLETELPKIVPIQRYRNLISNLLVDIPLYEPLINRINKNQKVEKLNITILGVGEIGTEMFLSCYWISQMLNIKTVINIVSKEPEEDFWNKINAVNNEIRPTTTTYENISKKIELPLLKYNSKEYAEPYCYTNYINCDVNSTGFAEIMNSTDDEVITKADYILISLGSDANNISIANQVCRHIGQKCIENCDSKKTVITYVVYDSELSETLNQNKWHSFTSETSDVYMQAIGSFKELYSEINVFMEKFDEKLKHIERGSDVLDADYRFWAEVARKMHRKYKAFSIGLAEKSIFDFKNTQKEYNEYNIQVLSKYKKFALGIDKTERCAEEINLLHQLAWLEHRRWNAFTRVRGFKSTFLYDSPNGWFYEKYYKLTGSYKHWALKLHPCIVESDKLGVRTEINDDRIDNLKICKRTIDLLDEEDYLDKFSKSLNKNCGSDDFKIYDYPCEDKFDDVP